MSFQYPVMVAVAVVVGLALAAAYRWLPRQWSRALADAGLTSPAPGWAALRRHLPPVLFLTAVTLLLLAVARPQATVAGTRAPA